LESIYYTKQCFKASNTQVRTPQIAYHMQKKHHTGGNPSNHLRENYATLKTADSLLPFPDFLVISAVIIETCASRAWQRAGDWDGGRTPRQHAGNGAGGRAHML
jgi:hypothetical protein